ncbi:AAA family ATPase [Pelagibacterium sediminicola]|uniref:AAA family ATPase n=1 Tax=Pelagibacterium sediminicola TaxID=2248761 RepID=UPI000E315E4A|nr:AAA family ATPase [Pelagibacterium sediminicola]
MPATADSARAYLFQRETIQKMIELGRLPTLLDLLEGHYFARDDVYFDLFTWAGETIAHAREELSADTAAAIIPTLEKLQRRNPGHKSLSAALALFEHLQMADEAARCLAYLASLGSREARQRLAAVASKRVQRCPRDMTILYMSATVFGLVTGESGRTSMREYCEAGLARFDSLSKDLAALHEATTTKPTAPDPADDLDDDFMQAVLEDRAEFFKGNRLKGHVVVPKLPDNPSRAQADLFKSWKDLAGKRLRVVQRGELPAQRAELVGRWPHAVDVINVILRDLSADERVRIRPTILVGPPGSGKSTLARAIAETLGLPAQLVPLAGLADGSVAGTSAQWSTARESVPLQVIKSSKCANPAVVWDEIDKTTSSHNGSTVDALLPMLEPSTSRRIRDLALEVEVDLSLVSHFATANSLEGVPAPLKDRMRIISMPDPEWQHVGTLVRGILDDVSKERGLDRRWIDDLAEDELDLVHQQWPGGSLRQLRRIIEIMVDGREKMWGRA